MNDLVVYGTPVSPFVRKVEAVLHTQGVPYDFEMINIMDMPDWFIEISPARRIPVLRDRTIGEEGVADTIADSSAICVYLDRKFDAGLYGKDAFESGRIAWLEEYADTELALPLGMRLFRPILFPRFSGQDSDLETARKTYQEELPRHFDYLEQTLDGNEFFVGDTFSLADIAVGVQMTQLDLVAGTVDDSRWPSLARHTQAMKAHPGFVDNLSACGKMLGRLVPEKVDLNGQKAVRDK
ncbi:MAG: glutathione S-transferase family protein [Pseudomonadales bacterium]|nr:glutathione S-transferase family protein [Pseudomonadales bacterium]MBO6564640.1 glutathione S-transferase family protein [Pseudomonadales bacterium]MBO6597226.1 glutathione S-transferase family protein [Pseudomonadales bacterium]MBO6823588.1 glutathione S-transferase family protein [Pseudomonadales bacterium]